MKSKFKPLNLIIILFLITITILLLIKSLTYNTKPEYINVTDFGALGNDSLDDTPAIVNAISSFNKKDKYLYFPAGTYFIKNLNLPSNIHILGESNSTILKASSDCVTWDRVISISNNNITIENIILDGNIENIEGNTEEGVFLLKVDNAKNITILNSKFQNSKYCSIVFNGCDNINVDNCQFINTDVGTLFMDSPSKNVTISNNYFNGGTSEGISLYGRMNGYLSNFKIYNNTIKNKSMHGIQVRQSKNIKIYNNSIYNCGTGITIERYEDFICDNIIIKNNVIDSCTLEGINIKDNNISLYSNKILNTGEIAVLIINADNINFKDNYIENYNISLNTKGEAIHAENLSNSNFINNSFILNLKSDLVESHIFIYGDCHKNIFLKNYFSPESLDPIHDYSNK